MDHKIKKQWRKIIMKSNIDSEEIPIKLKKKKTTQTNPEKKKKKDKTQIIKIRN